MYRIFISSTYLDLKEERKQIIKSILRLGHYPICMETFVATQGHQLDFIRDQLDTADIYVVILARRYGSSICEDKCSYTEREYEYAKQIGLPTLAMICSEKYEPTEENKKTEQNRIEAWTDFAKKLKQEKHLVHWDNAIDLISAIDSSINTVIKDGIEGWTHETKYYKIKRKEIDNSLKDIQDEIYKIINLSETPETDSFLSLCNRLNSVCNILQDIGLSTRDRVRFNKIDYLYFLITSHTEAKKLNPLPLYWYAKFLHEFYDLPRAIETGKKYLDLCTNYIEQARVNVFIGMIALKLKHFDEARQYLDKSSDILCSFNYCNMETLLESISNSGATSEKNKELLLVVIGELFNNYGLIYDNTKKHEKATIYYDYAVAVLKHLIQLTGEKYLYKYQLYKFNQTSANFKCGNKFFVIRNIEEIIELLNNLPSSINKSKRLARTHQLYGDSIKDIDRTKSDEEYECSAHLYEEIIETQERYLNAFGEKFKENIAWCYHKLSEVYKNLRQYHKAIKVLTNAIEYREELFLSSRIQDHPDYMLSLAESEFLISKLFFENCDKERNSYYVYEAFRYADDAFFYYEQLFDMHIYDEDGQNIFKKEYNEITELNISICIFLKNKEKEQFFIEKLKKVA